MELEAVIVPTADLDILIGFGWLDGKVESDNLLFDEKEPALAPEISLNAVVQYTFPVDLLGGNVQLEFKCFLS